MRKAKIANLVNGYADQLIGIRADDPLAELSGKQLAEIETFLQLSRQLHETIKPTHPDPVFRARLKGELMTAIGSRSEEREMAIIKAAANPHRWVWVGAAAGSMVLSVAGVIAALLLHQRAVAQTKA